MKILTKYMLRSLIPNYFVGLAFFTILLLVNEVFRMVALVIERNASPDHVMQLFVFTIPYVLALTIPMAVIIASILTFGRMSNENEIVALRGSGISLRRIIWPNFFFGLALLALALLFYDTVLPWGNYRYVRMRRIVFMGDPMADFGPNQLIDIGGQTIHYDREDPGTKLMHDVYITHPDGTIIFAKEGEFVDRVFFRDKMLLSFRLRGVTIDENDRKKPTEFLCTQAPVIIQTFSHNFDLSGEVAKTASTMSIRELYAKIKRDNEGRVKLIQEAVEKREMFRTELDKERKFLEEIYNQDPSVPQNQRVRPGRAQDPAERENSERRIAELDAQVQNQESRIGQLRQSKGSSTPEDLYEFQKKFALPFACLVFTMVGAPMGMFSRRSGKSLGFGYAVVILVIYYVLLTLGQGWAISERVNPVFSAWMPDIFIGTIGIILVLKKLRE
ncbi:MAG: LptF/LptG family permease [Spirochaetota bacterium]|nr:LptF/LptG family permease [Spirochaetota bacterium]